jgi:SsrA-binding protein
MTTLIEYKKAGLKFERLEEFEAGIELFGFEVKALKGKQGSLDGSRILVRGGEAYLVGMTIPPYQAANTPKSYDPMRTRRLLMKKAEIRRLADEEAKKGLTIVPIEVYNKGNLLKVRVAVVRGKGKADRREDLKRQDAKREASRVLKSR